MFSTLYGTYFSFQCTLKCRLQFVSIWTSLNFCRLTGNHMVSFYICRLIHILQYFSTLNRKYTQTSLQNKSKTAPFSSLPHIYPRKKALQNIVGKGENAGNQYFLLFLQCFSILSSRNSINFSHT